MNELAIGQISASVVLSIVLGLIYKTFTVPDKYKAFIAIIIGIGLGIVAMYYYTPAGQACTFKMCVDYVLSGFMTGATSVGLYEATRTVTNPRG